MSTQEHAPEQLTAHRADVIDMSSGAVQIELAQAPVRTHEEITAERRRRLQTAAELGVVTLGHNAAERIQAHATAAAHRNLIQG